MNEKIFVVEDDSEDIAFLTEAFHEIGFGSIMFFSNPFDIIKQLEKLESEALPRLLLTDYKMPKIDGFNIAAYIKHNNRYKNIMVIVMSGSIHDDETHRLMRAGVSKIFTKPQSYEGYVAIASELSRLASGIHSA